MSFATRMFTLVFGMVFWLSAPAKAQIVDDSDMFRLWNDCRGVWLVVEEMSDSAAKIRLTKDAIERTVRSRLRGARIYNDSTLRSDGNVRPYFYVNVNVVGDAFGVRMELNKWLRDPLSKQDFIGTSWDMSSTGTHAQDANYILAGIAQDVDLFIDEYLRVNDAAC